MFENNYSSKIVSRNFSADQNLLGVQLGRLCIANNTPVVEIAEIIGVTKNSVYRWFTGEYKVSKHLAKRVRIYIETTARREVPESEFIV